MDDKISKLGYLAGATRLRRISEKLQYGGDRIYQAAGMYFKARWFPVYYLLTLNHSATINELAIETGLNETTLRNILRELLFHELIEYKEEESERHVQLSEKGKNLLPSLSKVWQPIIEVTKEIFQQAHPDFMSIVSRLEEALLEEGVDERLESYSSKEPIYAIDYAPALQKELMGILNYTAAEISEQLILGGFLFIAKRGDSLLGAALLSRLDDDKMELSALGVLTEEEEKPVIRVLVARIICRMKENRILKLVLAEPNLGLVEGLEELFKEIDIV